MGVFIDAYKVKKRICDILTDEDFDAIKLEWGKNNEEIITLSDDDNNDYDDVTFENGVYNVQGGNNYTDMSYSSWIDFRDTLDEMDADFHNTLSVSGIEGWISYNTAESVLEELETNKEEVEKTLLKRFGDDYGDFLWRKYERYIEVMKECVELKGIVLYH